MTHTVTIRLGWPAAALFQNDNAPRVVKARATKRARMEAWGAALSAGIKRLPKCDSYTLNFTFTPPRRKGGQYDPTNMRPACKAAIDGIADALGVNDRTFRPGSETILPARGAGSVEIEVIPSVVMIEVRGAIR